MLLLVALLPIDLSNICILSKGSPFRRTALCEVDGAKHPRAMVQPHEADSW